jgi:hypothetical protein
MLRWLPKLPILVYCEDYAEVPEVPFSILFHNIFHVFLHKWSFFKFSLPITYDASFGKHKFSQPFTKAEQKYPASTLKANYLNLYNSNLLNSYQKTEGFFNLLLPIFDTVIFAGSELLFTN